MFCFPHKCIYNCVYIPKKSVYSYHYFIMLLRKYGNYTNQELWMIHQAIVNSKDLVKTEKIVTRDVEWTNHLSKLLCVNLMEIHVYVVVSKY